MKKDFHPAYYPTARITCACGTTIETGSTEETLHTEVCSACHPFYTGKQKLVDVAGRVDTFKKKLAAAHDKRVKHAPAKKSSRKKSHGSATKAVKLG